MINRFFDESFSSGDELKAYFMFTLSETTEELFPLLGVRYPGLEEDDRFEARIKIGSPIEGAMITGGTLQYFKMMTRGFTYLASVLILIACESPKLPADQRPKEREAWQFEREKDNSGKIPENIREREHSFAANLPTYETACSECSKCKSHRSL